MTAKKKKTQSAIEKLDKNFKTAAVKQTLRWYDAFDSHLALRGLAWLKENKKAKNFHRLPKRAAGRLSVAVQGLALCPSSVFVSFFTDSPEIAVRIVNEDVEMMRNMPMTGMSGAELFVREGTDWLSVATAVPLLDDPAYELPLITGNAKEMREYRLYLPLYKPVNKVALGFAPKAKVKPSPTPAGVKPVFFYGTSITQGGCANTTGSDFVSILGRKLDTEIINFGFSGSGKGEPEVAELMREIDAEIFVLDYAENCDTEGMRRTLPEFVRILRERHPETPILIISPICYSAYFWKKDYRRTTEEMRNLIMERYLQLRNDGDENIHFLDGFGLIPPGGSGIFSDGVHPSSGGFSIMAERLLPYLHAIRIWKRNESK
ncbi:MAG: SGNH/GDSL hydrolase family protein [Chthoniobacterales bacterium]